MHVDQVILDDKASQEKEIELNQDQIDLAEVSLNVGKYVGDAYLIG